MSALPNARVTRRGRRNKEQSGEAHELGAIGLLESELELGLGSKSESETKIEDQGQFKGEVGEAVMVCGFSPRASQTGGESVDTEARPVNPARLACLDAAIARYEGMSVALLTGPDLAGTPPARIYRSFVAPRRSAIHQVTTHCTPHHPPTSPMLPIALVPPNP